MLLGPATALAVGDNSAQGPFTLNASTRIVVDDNMQYITGDFKGGGWTKYWTNVAWSGGVIDLTCVGGDNVIRPGMRLSHEGTLPVWSAVRYLSDAINRMTGARPATVGNMDYTGRPWLYCRTICPTRGSSAGATGGTIAYRRIKASFPKGLPAPDETAEVSDRDWQVGFRIDGMSSPGSFPHQGWSGSFAYPLVADMLATGSSKGFLCMTKLGPDAARPPATADMLNWLWLNTDTSGPGKGKIFWCTISAKSPYWQDRSRGTAAGLATFCPPHIDMSVPVVRHMLLKEMIKEAESFWALNPGQSYSYPCRLGLELDGRWRLRDAQRRVQPGARRFLRFGRTECRG